MGRELMWVCAIAPEEFQKRTTQLCLTENKSIGLPENVFKLPLHISLKESFYTESFDAVKFDILSVLNLTGKFRCRIAEIELHRNMLWLPVTNGDKLRLLHEKIDRLLEAKYGIPISGYDRNFQPHISLFTRGAPEQVRDMYDRLRNHDFGSSIEISRFVIGSSGHKDTFIH